MEAKMVSGKFTAANAVATNVECGFIPDEVQLISDLGGAEKHYKWAKVLYDEAAALTGKYGYDLVDSPTPLTDADNGIIPYDVSVDSVLIPAPDGDGFVKAAAVADFDITEAAYVARDLTAGAQVLGSIVRPTVHNGYVYECLVTAGASDPQPTWPTVVGDTVADVGGNTWICREERIMRTGVKGFTIGATLSVDGQYWFFKAELHDRHAYMGDADVENPVTFGGHLR